MTKNVWGGCMLLQADALRGDGPGAVGAAWGAPHPPTRTHPPTLLRRRTHSAPKPSPPPNHPPSLTPCLPHPPLIPSAGDGAYSDDLILASLAGSLGAPILCPAESVFPNQLSGRTGAREWWNYLHRQLYVLDTYMSPYNRRGDVCSSCCGGGAWC